MQLHEVAKCIPITMTIAITVHCYMGTNIVHLDQLPFSLVHEYLVHPILPNLVPGSVLPTRRAEFGVGGTGNLADEIMDPSFGNYHLSETPSRT